MKTLEEYISENGFLISDFTDGEIERLKQELEIINDGGNILDGLFSEKSQPDYGV